MCKEKLLKISGELCQKCGRPLSALSPQYYQSGLCSDCQKWEQDAVYKGTLGQNRSLYLYNSFCKDVMAQFKFRGDYALLHLFQSDWVTLYKQVYSPAYLLVPIPLSDERLYERGFNQSLALAELLSSNIYEGLTRIHHEKQSKKSRGERLEMKSVFNVRDGSRLKSKDVVLIDDIYTTGMTLHAAAIVLKQAGANSVQSFTLARS